MTRLTHAALFVLALLAWSGVAVGRATLCPGTGCVGRNVLLSDAPGHHGED